MTPRQAERETGLTYTLIRDLHRRGHLPVVKLPGTRRWWIRRTDLDALIERSAASPINGVDIPARRSNRGKA
jgi:excisionase family DNA binding protein